MIKLTIILLSYNRLELLRRAVDSCLSQTDLNFNLLIIDNGSTDGSADYLESIAEHEGRVEVVLRNTNFGASSSELMGVELSKTEWMTYLCDDDYLSCDFVARFNQIEGLSEFSCVVFSCAEVDSLGIIKREIKNTSKEYKPADGVRAVLSGEVCSAGISNFFFRKTAFNSDRLLPLYPNGWLRDTFLFARASAEKRLLALPECLYFKQLHPDMASGFSAEKWIEYFEAMVTFDNDVRREMPLMMRDIRRPGLISFGKVVIFPIFVNGALSFRESLRYMEISLNVNKNFIPHALMVVVLSPFLGKRSLKFRIWLNLIRKNWREIYLKDKLV